MEFHPDLEPLSFLLGEWEGFGSGSYPTIDDFSYREVVTVKAPPGKAFLSYGQQTWRAGDHADSGQPLHTEAGYFRPGGSGKVELALAQPTGVAEIHHGTVAGTSIALKATSVATTATAKAVDSVERNITVSGDEMVYELRMGAVGEPHQVHLKATLTRHQPQGHT